MPDSDTTHIGGSKVFVPFHLKRGQSKTDDLSASESLAEFFEVPLAENVGGVLINNLTNKLVNFNDFDGTDADATKGTMAGNEVQFFEGTPAELATMRIFATNTHSISITQFVART